MSEKEIQKVKKNGPFKRLDLLVYGLIALGIILTALAVFLPKNGQISGVSVTYGGQTVATIPFNGEPILSSEYVTRNGNEYTIKTPDGENVLFVEGETVKMLSSDCLGGECLSMTGRIVCIPHRLVVESVALGDNGQVITG